MNSSITIFLAPLCVVADTASVALAHSIEGKEYKTPTKRAREKHRKRIDLFQMELLPLHTFFSWYLN
jgi:hypothetical protein